MSEFTNNIKKRSEKLQKLVNELESIDRFRESVKRWSGDKVEIVSSSSNGSAPVKIDAANFAGLDGNIKGLIEVAFAERHKEIEKILKDEFGGAWETVREERESDNPY